MTREELIDFCEWCNRENHYDFIYKSIVDKYLASINDSSVNEVPALVPIEGKEKVCLRCMGKGYYIQLDLCGSHMVNCDCRQTVLPDRVSDNGH